MKGGRKNYGIWTGEERAESVRLAHKHGNAIALNMLAGRYPKLTKQSLSDFKKAYLALKSNEDEVLVIKTKKDRQTYFVARRTDEEND